MKHIGLDGIQYLLITKHSQLLNDFELDFLNEKSSELVHIHGANFLISKGV